MRTIKLVFEGEEADNGDIVFPDGTRLPQFLKSQAVSEEVIAETIENGDYVTNDAYNIVALSTDNGYVILMDVLSPERVGTTVATKESVGNNVSKVNSSMALARVEAAASKRMGPNA